MTTQIVANSGPSCQPPAPARRRVDRDAEAAEIVKAHLTDIHAHKIVRRFVNGRVVWLVQNGRGEQHVVTLEPETCDCQDRRFNRATCKHIRACQILVEAEAAKVATEPKPEPKPAPRTRLVYREEIDLY